MKKVLLTGNSQAAVLAKAFSSVRSTLDDVAEFFFHVVPGGYGPSLKIEEGRIRVVNEKFNTGAYFFPEQTPDMHVSDFDAIIICSLGYVDGGYRYENPFLGGVVMPEFGVTEKFKDTEYVSESCFNQLILDTWENLHPGFRFARQLRQAYDGNILVQPFPRVSIALADNEEWAMRQKYVDWMGAHSFTSNAQDQNLKFMSEKMGFSVMERPKEADAGNYFTKAHLMLSDGVHPSLENGAEYGAMVLRGIAKNIENL